MDEISLNKQLQSFQRKKSAKRLGRERSASFDMNEHKSRSREHGKAKENYMGYEDLRKKVNQSMHSERRGSK